jgi:AhpD family alkylhydroperoxidase
MTPYPVHTVDSAPAGSRETLRHVEQTLGAVPNLAAAMAESPSLVNGFFKLREIFYAGTLSPVEIQVLALTNAFENGCRYCMALHSVFALKDGLSPDSLAALRAGRAPTEPRLAALSGLSRRMISARGQVDQETLASFFAAGYTAAQAQEVIVGVAVSVMANYAHHLTHAPVDAVFESQAWTPPASWPVPAS